MWRTVKITKTSPECGFAALWLFFFFLHPLRWLAHKNMEYLIKVCKETAERNSRRRNSNFFFFFFKFIQCPTRYNTTGSELGTEDHNHSTDKIMTTYLYTYEGQGRVLIVGHMYLFILFYLFIYFIYLFYFIFFMD